MKTIFVKFFILGIIIVCFAGCTEQTESTSLQSGGIPTFLYAEVESSNSRTMVLADGTHHWLDGDCIGVYGTKTQNAEFLNQSYNDNGTRFYGALETATEEVKFAYFPYMDETVYSEGELTISIPDKRVVDNSNPAPMIGYPTAENTIHFTHLGAVLKVRFVGLPENAHTLTVTTLGDDSPYLSGQAIVKTDSDDRPVYQIIKGSRKIEFDLQTIGDKEYINAIHIPLQVGKYEKIIVSIFDESGELLVNKSLSNVKATRAHVILTPMLNFSDKLYMYQFSEEWIQENIRWQDRTWDAVLYTDHDEMIMIDETEDEVFYVYMNAYLLNDNGSPWCTLIASLDLEGRPKGMYLNGKTFLYQNYTETTYDLVVISNGQIKKTEGLPYEPKNRIVNRASTTDYSLERIEQFNEFINGDNNVLEQASELLENTKDIKDIVNENDLEIVKVDDIVSLSGDVRDKVNIKEMSSNLFMDALKGSIQLITSGITATYHTYMEGRSEQNFGNAQVSVASPTLVGKKIVTGCIVTNASSCIDSGNYTHAGLMYMKVPANQATNIPNIYFNHPDVIKTSVHNVNNQVPIYIDYEPGYVYFIKPYLQMDDDYNVDKKSIYAGATIPYRPGAEIESLPTQNLEYKNGEFYKSFNVIGSTDDMYGTYYIIMQIWDIIGNYRQEPVIKSWNMNNNVIPLECIIPVERVSFTDMNFPMVSIYCSSSDDKSDELDYEFVTFTYEKEAKLSVKDVIIRPIGRSVTRTPTADEQEEYEDEITIVLQSEGTGHFKDVYCKYSSGAVWKANSSPTDDGQEFRCKGIIKYSKKMPPGKVTVKGSLRKETEYTGQTISFTGVPISGYTLN